MGGIGLIPESYVQVIDSSVSAPSQVPSIQCGVVESSDAAPEFETSVQVTSAYTDVDYEIQAMLNETEDLSLEGSCFLMALFIHFFCKSFIGLVFKNVVFQFVSFLICV